MAEDRAMDDGRLERLEQRLEDLDRRESAMERTMDTAMRRSRQAVNTLVPDETRRHMRAAWRENLLAVRSFIDYWADRLNDRADDSQEPNSGTGGRENIRID
jgi:hypothetical protein